MNDSSTRSAGSSVAGWVCSTASAVGTSSSSDWYCSDTCCSISSGSVGSGMGAGECRHTDYWVDPPEKTQKTSLPKPRSSSETMAIITSTNTITTKK